MCENAFVNAFARQLPALTEGTIDDLAREFPLGPALLVEQGAPSEESRLFAA
jgi:hypothetical protein